ncbi:MAG: class I SAM-dependent methyltransferase, partial [Myxococcota bacterium]
EPTASSAEQRFMESELVANVYERVWRPSFVRVMAGRGASASTGGFAGEFFIHKNCLAMDDRDGPWLDLSCGPGLFTRAMAAAAPGSHIIGLDISRAMLEVAARRAQGYTNVTFIRADAHHLPIADASLGGVNSSGALHAYDDPERAFGEIVRVLRPGGVFVASTFARANSLLGRAAAHLGGIRRYDSLRLRAQLARIGLIDYEEVVFGGSLIFRVRRP